MTIETLIIILNLVILESLLSIDNAAVLAIMVKDLPGNQKAKALKYGLLGAYVFRGLCLLAASWLVKVLWLKIAGGLYLVYLAYGHFSSKVDTVEEKIDKKNEDRAIFRFAKKHFGMGTFWATIFLVEMMDLTFSIDNIFAAVALSDKFWIIMVGVAIGILAMRFVATFFVKLIEKYPSLERSAFIVIAILGLKLVLSGVVDYIPSMHTVNAVMSDHKFDLVFSGLIMLVFFFPIVFSKKR